VLSAFGVQFAPRPETVARELARVCRTGGRIGLLTWTRTGHMGELLAIIDRHLEGEADPTALHWGDEDGVQGLFEGTGVDLEFARGHNPVRFDSAEEYVRFMETRYGPLVRARARLVRDGLWQACRAEVLAAARRRDQADDGSLLMYAEYLIVIGHKRA
jgi:hypothetical protein